MNPLEQTCELSQEEREARSKIPSDAFQRALEPQTRRELFIIVFVYYHFCYTIYNEVPCLWCRKYSFFRVILQ